MVWIELIFFLIAGTVLSFVFRMRRTSVTHRCSVVAEQCLHRVKEFSAPCTTPQWVGWGCTRSWEQLHCASFVLYILIVLSLLLFSSFSVSLNHLYLNPGVFPPSLLPSLPHPAGGGGRGVLTAAGVKPQQKGNAASPAMIVCNRPDDHKMSLKHLKMGPFSACWQPLVQLPRWPCAAHRRGDITTTYRLQEPESAW